MSAPLATQAPIGRSAAWTILRDTARAPEGFVACCRDAGTDPDAVVLGAVNIMARHRGAVCPCGWHVNEGKDEAPAEGWVCVRFGTRKPKAPAPPPAPTRACERCRYTPAPGRMPVYVSNAGGGRWLCWRCHFEAVDAARSAA